MERVEANRNFGNKLWNAGKFLQMSALAGLSEEERQSLRVDGPMRAGELATLPLAERFIVTKCHALAEEVNESIDC
jgi:valyl-tRNA synthetase